jgi:serine phosphatase RsbU (regulator of sigma subunit)
MKFFLILTLFIVPSFFFAQKGKSDFLLNKANELFKSNPDSSFVLCNQANELNVKENRGDVLLCRARYFLTVSDYENSELELNKAIFLFEKQKDFTSLSSAFSLKSILYDRINNQELHEKYLLKSYHLDKMSNNESQLINRLFNLVNLYIGLENVESSKKYLDELEKFKTKFHKEDNYYYHQNRGLYFLLIKNSSKAIDEFNFAKNEAIKYKMLDSRATILTFLADAYLENKQTNLALDFAYEGYEFSVKNKLKFEEMEALEVLINVLEKGNNYKQAFEFQKKYNTISNELLNIEKLNKINEINDRLHQLENQRIIDVKNNKIDQQKKYNDEVKSKSKILSLFLIFAVLSIFIIGFVFVRTKKLNKIIGRQKNLVEEKNQEILDSITYAKRIQSAILPQPKLVKEYFRDSFILYKPKDIVAGDFYWFEAIDNLIFFAAADCTGHGVPGAMVSVVCHNALNRSIKEFSLTNPASILDKTREIVIAEFEKSEEDVKDGMNISLCVLDSTTKLLSWAGAHNPLWILRSTSRSSSDTEALEKTAEIIEFRADKQPIGKFSFAKAFTNHEIQLVENDIIYIFTDGFQDQFGGEKGKKYKISQIRELLLSISSKNLEEQKNLIDQNFETWKGQLDQVDDVCLMGVKI